MSAAALGGRDVTAMCPAKRPAKSGRGVETGGGRFAPVFPGLSPIRGGGSMGVSVSTSSLVAHSLTWHGTDIALVEVGVLC